MIYVNDFLILSALLLALTDLCYWLVKGQIDQAAIFIAISTSKHAVYLHSIKSNKIGYNSLAGPRFTDH